LGYTDVKGRQPMKIRVPEKNNVTAVILLLTSTGWFHEPI